MDKIPTTARTILDDLEGLWGSDLSDQEIRAEVLAETHDAQRREGGTPMTAEEIEASARAHVQMCKEMGEMRGRGRG